MFVGQAKTLRVLQYFPQPDDPALTESLTETLRRIITGACICLAFLKPCRLTASHGHCLSEGAQPVSASPVQSEALPSLAHALAMRFAFRLRLTQASEGLPVTRMAAGTEVAKNINKNNAQHAIVFEAVALALAMEVDEELLASSVGLLGKFISVREPNIKYLGLENMVRLAEVPAVQDIITR